MILLLQRVLARPLFTTAAFLFTFQIVHAGPAPVLQLSGKGVSENGHVRIEWTLDNDVLVEVQQSQDEDFSTARLIYRGLDDATVVSGLENGTYYYRIRFVDGDWSDPVALKVKHHSHSLAIALFSLGAIVFLSTTYIVVKGALDTRSS